MRFLKTVFSIIAALLAFQAGAATTFDTKEACFVAKSVYTPTAKHKKFADQTRIKGSSERGLEHNACVRMDTAAGKKWAYLPSGTKVLVKGIEPAFLSECRNTIYEVVYEPRTASPQVAAASAPQGTCSTGACGEVTKVIPVTTVFDHKYQCRYPDGRQVEATMKDGSAICPDVVVSNPVTVSVPSRCENCSGGSSSTPLVGQSSSCQPGGVCIPTLSYSKSAVRTDGRCVLEVHDSGKTIFVRFGAQNGGHLSAVVVSGPDGNFVGKPSNTMVGDGTGTIKLDMPLNCAVAIKAFSQESVLRWTAPRLGLTNCQPKGQV